MRRSHGLHSISGRATLLALALLIIGVFTQAPAIAQSKSASIISLSTDRATYFSGELVTMALVVQNTGNSQMQILCNIVIVNPAGEQVFSHSRKYDLANNATNNYEFYWTVPYKALPGLYHVHGTIADGTDGRYYSSRSCSFNRSIPPQSARSASLLELHTDRQNYIPGDVSAITVIMQNTSGSDISMITAVDVINPTGIQVYTGVKETTLRSAHTDSIDFTLPIPDNAANGTYQIQATVADKTDGKFYGSKSTTIYVQPTAAGNIAVNKNTAPQGFKLPDLGLSGWGQYLITGLLIALAIMVIIILIRNRSRSSNTEKPAYPAEDPEDTSNPEPPE